MTFREHLLDDSMPHTSCAICRSFVYDYERKDALLREAVEWLERGCLHTSKDDLIARIKKEIGE